jgi:hypothetical protein
VCGVNDPNPFIPRQTTIVQVSQGDGDLPFLEIHGSILALDSGTELYIDGVRWAVVRRRVDVDIASRAISTTITVVPWHREATDAVEGEGLGA